MVYVAVYWLAIRLYAGAVRLAALFKPKARLFIEGRKGLLQRMEQTLGKEGRPRVWMHCASLGEFEQGRPLLEALREQYPNYAFVLTFFSPSGYEARKDFDGADYIYYLPLDSKANASHFLDVIQPSLCIFVKYELWYYYLSTVAKRGIPIILISSIFKKNDIFFKWYGALSKKMLGFFNHIFVQDERSKRLLLDAGFTEVSISGDTRFDRVIEAAATTIELPVAETFCRYNKVLVAGSTWKEDEVFLKKTMAQLPIHWKLIIVPHEVHNTHIAAIEKLFAGKYVTWSKWQNDVDKQVLIVDKIGVLLPLYKYATAAWIGGGFGKAGIHNVLEAAVYGKPCAFGPVFHQFLEAEELLQAGGAVTTKDPEALAKQILQWEGEAGEETGAAARQYVLSRQGATSKVINYLSGKNLLRIL